MKDIHFIVQTPSTNSLCWKMDRDKSLPEGFVLYTDFQQEGKGQPGNSWESAVGKNLLFSLVLHPVQVPMEELFLLSQIVSVGIKNALEEFSSNISIKWPNDIYWHNKKLAGILIENSLQGNRIKTVVVGIGLNVNQKKFVSDAPNPVSLLQISGRTQNRNQLLERIHERIMELYNEYNVDKIRSEYARSLFRKEGYHTYQAEKESFQAKIIEVHNDGQLELEKINGERCSFYFKEVNFIV